MAYDTTRIPWQALSLPTARATELLTRLDERLARSPVGEGWIQRMHFHDAAAALWLEGELVHLEDLVLHDAHMDIRAPTHELTRAHAVLRARRQIHGSKPGWALGHEGLLHLTRRTAPPTALATPTAASQFATEQGDVPDSLTGTPMAEGPLSDDADATEELAGPDFSEIDALLDRTSRLLEADVSRPELAVAQVRAAAKDPLVYDLDWDEGERLSQWQALLTGTHQLPSVLRAAILLDGWQSIDVLQHSAWLGPLLAAETMRQAGVSANHLASLAMGLRLVARERRRAGDQATRLHAFLEAMSLTAELGLKEHDRLALARTQLERRLRDRRSNSRLPQLIELVLARPLVSTNMVQQQLKTSRQGALDLIGELGLREITGRKRFQAWAVS